MKPHHAVPSVLIALLLATAPALAEPAHDAMPGDMAMPGLQNPVDMKWAPAPPVLPKGGMITVLSGDPFKPGPYVIRLMAPAGYKVMPHWHSAAENVTIISGTLYLGMGDTLDMKAAHMLKAGGFHSIGKEVHHYAFTKKGAVIQIHGDGPFDIHYINPDDDPSKVAKK